MSKWNLVGSKLPDDDKLKLVYIEDEIDPIYNSYGLCHYERNNWYCDGGRNSQEVVTRWMDIPEYKI